MHYVERLSARDYDYDSGPRQIAGNDLAISGHLE